MGKRFIFLFLSIFFILLSIRESEPKRLDGSASCGDSQQGDYLYDAPIPGLNGYHSRHRRSVIADEERLWKDGKIPYVFDSGISGAGRRLITKSMSHWENGTCIKFVKRTTEKDYVLIYRGRGCCSHVGKLGGMQKLSLGTGCLRFGIIVHELGHTIGFYHEQNRPDRSSYIDILYNNVDRTKYANFDVKSDNEVETFDQAYDYKSIMHYGSKFFSKNGYDTIRAKTFHDIDPNSIGEAYYSHDGPVLSKQDIIKANLLYKCSTTVAFEGCGGSLSAASGELHIKGRFPVKKTNMDCEWIISPRTSNNVGAGNASLSLNFDMFDVGSVDAATGACNGAFIEIREGKGFLSPLIGQFCGKSLPKRILSLSSTLYVRLRLIADAKRDYIEVNALGQYKTNDCSRSFTGLRGVLQSPGFPRPYKHNLDCVWQIKVKKGYNLNLYFITFLLHDFTRDQECTDYVDIFEGSINGKHIGRFCGSTKPGPFYVTSNKAVLVLHSGSTDIGVRGLGFSAFYEAKDVDECALKIHNCPHVCVNFNGGYGCACYQGYYRVLLSDSDQSTCIDVDECRISNGHCSHKCVNTDGSYFCTCPKGYFLSPNKTTCQDVDECLGPDRQCSQKCQNFPGGFRCSCKAGYLLGEDGRTCSALPLCGGRISLPLGMIKSPIVPITYKKHLVCRWKVHTGLQYGISLRIKLRWLKNDNCQNYLILKRKSSNGAPKQVSKICSFYDIGGDILIEGNSFVLEYHATPPFQPRFEVRYHSIAKSSQRCNRVINSSFDWFRSPGYPFRYPYNTNCVWTLVASDKEVIRLVFTDFDLEDHSNCAFDYLEVEEHSMSKKTIKFIGRFCGKTSPKEIVSTRGSKLMVRFHSDSTLPQRGLFILVWNNVTIVFSETNFKFLAKNVMAEEVDNSGRRLRIRLNVVQSVSISKRDHLECLDVICGYNCKQEMKS